MPNIYLEKIAATYEVPSHSLDSKILDLKKLNLSEKEYNKYLDYKDKVPVSRFLKGTGVGAAAGSALGALIAPSGFKGLAGMAGGILGASLGVKSINNTVHDESLENIGLNKYIQRLDKEDKNQD